MTHLTPHLQHLEEESIYIIREAVASSERPALLYSIGKDSSVLLHLLLKAFYPIKPPVPLLHVDTRWKFKEMIRFRDETVARHGLDLHVHINPDGIEQNINPIEHGSRLHTHMMKTEALKQVLNEKKYDFIFIGGRRDEEKARAKERIFSLRNRFHSWDPKNQRPEFGWLFNTRLPQHHSMRVSPLSNWTEYDIWSYIAAENIPVVPLYFAKQRPVVWREGAWILVDDERLPHTPDEVQYKMVRFRTLGCYPLTGAVESEAKTFDDILKELQNNDLSERQGRLIDNDQAGSMEKKKKMGYF
jgi:sulfate adenylyltransferase subunit 2